MATRRSLHDRIEDWKEAHEWIPQAVLGAELVLLIVAIGCVIVSMVSRGR